MRSLRSVFVVAIGLIFVSISVSAHHGNAEYDEKRPLTLKGTVTEFMWASPHSKICLHGQPAGGRAVSWGIEKLTPGKLARAGWTKDAVLAVDGGTIDGSGSETSVPTGFLQKVVFLDG